MERFCPISVLVRNEPGVLSRVAGLFARRGFNITSLAVGETDNPQVSRISIVVQADSHTLEQVIKQLQRLVSVIKVRDQSEVPRVERGLMLIKIKADASKRHEVVELANIFRARIDHVDQKTMVIECSGDRGKLEALMDMLRPYGIIEMARTGQIVLARTRSIRQGLDGAGPLGFQYTDEDNDDTFNVSKQYDDDGK